jgi:hypothetical protein
MSYVPVKSLKLPIEVLEYAHKEILNQISKEQETPVRNVADLNTALKVRLQDEKFIFYDLIELATVELRRLRDEAMGG